MKARDWIALALVSLALLGATSPQQAPGAYDDNDPAWVYAGTWSQDHEGCDGGIGDGCVSWTEEVDASVQLDLIGCGFEFHYMTSEFGGPADIYIDDVLIETIDQASVEIGFASWSTELAAGVHSFKVVFPGGDLNENINVDYGVVLPCATLEQLWDSLQQAVWIGYGNSLLWALGLGIAAATLLAATVVVGRIIGKYIRQ